MYKYKKTHSAVVDNSLYEELLKDIRRMKTRNEKRVYIPALVFEDMDRIITSSTPKFSIKKKITLMIQNMISR